MFVFYVVLSILHLGLFFLAWANGDIIAGVVLGLIGAIAWAYVAYVEKKKFLHYEKTPEVK